MACGTPIQDRDRGSPQSATEIGVDYFAVVNKLEDPVFDPRS